MATLKDKLIRAKDTVASTAVDVTNAASKIAKTTMTSLTDLNHDGKVDSDDLRIALDKAKTVGGVVAEETGKLARDVSKNPIVQNAAAGAVIGSLAIPFVGAVVGAKVGAVTGVLIGGGFQGASKVASSISQASSAAKKLGSKKPPAKKPAAKKVKAST